MYDVDAMQIAACMFFLKKTLAYLRNTAILIGVKNF